MANTLLLKRSSVVNKVPLGTDLTAGELAVNLADKRLYSKDGSGNVIQVGGDPSAFKQAVRCATTANITLSGTQTIDGIAVVANDRVLVKDQTSTGNNGIYVASASTWTRAADMDTAAEAGAAIVAVQSGTTNGGTLWWTSFKSTDTIGTTAMSWSKMGASAGGSSVTVLASAPSSPSSGDLWFDTNYAVLMAYYADGTSSQWVEVESGFDGLYFNSLDGGTASTSTWDPISINAGGAA